MWHDDVSIARLEASMLDDDWSAHRCLLLRRFWCPTPIPTNITCPTLILGSIAATRNCCTLKKWGIYSRTHYRTPSWHGYPHEMQKQQLAWWHQGRQGQGRWGQRDLYSGAGPWDCPVEGSPRRRGETERSGGQEMSSRMAGWRSGCQCQTTVTTSMTFWTLKEGPQVSWLLHELWL